MLRFEPELSDTMTGKIPETPRNLLKPLIKNQKALNLLDRSRTCWRVTRRKRGGGRTAEKHHRCCHMPPQIMHVYCTCCPTDLLFGLRIPLNQSGQNHQSLKNTYQGLGFLYQTTTLIFHHSDCDLVKHRWDRRKEKEERESERLVFFFPRSLTRRKIPRRL